MPLVSRCLAVCTSTVFLLGLFTPAAQAVEPDADLSVPVLVVSSFDKCTRISSAQLTNFMHTSNLEATADGDGGDPIKSITFSLVIVRDGRVVEGEGWLEVVSKDQPIQGTLRHESKLHLVKGDSATLFVVGVRTSRSVVGLKPDAAARLIASTALENSSDASNDLSGQLGATPEETNPNPPVTAFCTSGLTAAQATCSAYGVKTFTCNETGYSFTCESAPPKAPK